MTIYTSSGCHKFPFEEKFKILGYAMNRQGKSHDAIEERMQSDALAHHGSGNLPCSDCVGGAPMAIAVRRG